MDRPGSPPEGKAAARGDMWEQLAWHFAKLYFMTACSQLPRFDTSAILHSFTSSNELTEYQTSPTFYGPNNQELTRGDV